MIRIYFFCIRSIGKSRMGVKVMCLASCNVLSLTYKYMNKIRI